MGERRTEKEKQFSGCKVYYSGSIKGSPEADTELPWKLVQFMTASGADVLSEHVAARSQREMDLIRARKSGLELRQMLADSEPWMAIRRKDIEWVDECTHFVALVNAPSHGVGMEIERALLKPERGLNETPILCLVHEDLFSKLSYMIRGVDLLEHPNFNIRTYRNQKEAEAEIGKLLTSTGRN